MPRREATATIADVRSNCPEGVRVWCHTPGCPKQDKEALVTWDRIRVPDTNIFGYLKFKCVICGDTRTTFQPLWPRVDGQGPVSKLGPGASNMVEIPVGLPSWEELAALRAREAAEREKP